MILRGTRSSGLPFDGQYRSSSGTMIQDGDIQGFLKGGSILFGLIKRRLRCDRGTERNRLGWFAVVLKPRVVSMWSTGCGDRPSTLTGHVTSKKRTIICDPYNRINHRMRWNSSL